MGNFGIRVSKEGVNVSIVPTDSTKTNYTYLSTDNNPTIYYAGFAEESSLGAEDASYVHNLGKIPIFFVFVVDSVTNPTYFRPINAYSTTTTIYTEESYIYIIILREGS